MGTRNRFICVMGCAALWTVAACGGEAKPAQSPPPAATDQSSDTASKEQAAEEGATNEAPKSDGAEKGGASDKPAYDKEATEAVISRAARQIKANCGAATDDDGKATGPWGKPKVTITLGRNGHIAGVALPKDYEGQPTGKCIVKAFSNLTFPPYAGSSDATIDWEVEVVEPAAKPAAGKPGKK